MSQSEPGAGTSNMPSADDLRNDLPDAGPFLALAVSCTRAAPFDLWHIGVLYREGDGSPLRLLEMLGDQWLRAVDASRDDVGLTARYAWAPVHLSQTEQVQVFAQCALVEQWVLRHGAGVRLGFRYNGGTFARTTGAWTGVAGEQGLYCATTVLALFRSVGIELLDRRAWPYDPAMDAWIDGFAEILRKAVELPRRAVVLAEKPCVVFHPRAVMGACLLGRVGVSAAEVAAIEPAIEARYWRLRTCSSR